MDFPWLDRKRSPSGGSAARHAAQERELRDRAAMYFRLGYSEADATARLVAAHAWEHEPAGGAHRREITDAAIGELVRETYARRPSGTL